MLACKGIFAKPSMSQACNARIGRKPNDCVARVTAYIIAHFLPKCNMQLFDNCPHKFKKVREICVIKFNKKEEMLC